MDQIAPRRRGRPPRINPEIHNEATQMSDMTIDRPELRAPLREDDPVERARQRAAQILNHDQPDAIDEFATPDAPDGWSYQWKRHTLLNKEDPSYQVQLAQSGWTAVPASRHPEMMPSKGSYQTIERKGMILMEMPTEVVDRRRLQDLRKARNQVNSKEEQLSGAPAGTMTRDHPKAQPRIKKSFEPMQVPE